MAIKLIPNSADLRSIGSNLVAGAKALPSNFAQAPQILANIPQMVSQTVKSYLPGFGGPSQITIPRPQGQTSASRVISDNQNQPSGGGGVGGGIGGGGYSPLQAQLLGTQNVLNPNDIDFDALFAPAFAAYGNLEDTLRGSLDTALSGISTEETASLGRLGESAQEQRDLLAKAEKQTRQQEENAVADITRAASELQQSNLSRFGGASSTGQAATEILGQGLLRGIGQIKQTALNAIDQGAQELRRLETFVTNETERIKSASSQAKKEAQDQFNQALSQIGLAKGQLESDKAAQRLSALQNYKDKLLSIDQINNQLLNQVAQFNAQAQAQISSAIGSGQDERIKNYVSLVGTGLPQALAAQVAGLPQAGAFPQTSVGKGFQKIQDGLGNELLYNPATKEVVNPENLLPQEQEPQGGGFLSDIGNFFSGAGNIPILPFI